MKKSLVLGVITLGAASMLCGFDSAETVESLSQKMQEAGADLNGMSLNMDINLDAALNGDDGTNQTSLPITAKGSFTADYTIKPFAMKMDGSMNIAGLTNQSMNEQAYTTSDESGAFKMYIYAEDPTTGEGEWTVQTITDLNMDELLEETTNASASLNDLAEWGVSFTLAPEAADVNGTECYLLSTTMDSSTISTVLEKSSEMTGQEVPAELDTYLALLNGLNLKLEYYIDTTTYLPVKMHMDMNDSDLTVINQLIAQQLNSLGSEETPASTVELALNDLSIDVLCSFGEAPVITIPDEALAAEASGEASSLEDLAEAAEGTVAD